MNLTDDYPVATDGPGPLAELCARIDLSIGAVSDLTQALKRPKKPAPLPQPVFGRVRASGLAVTATPLVLTFDQPGPVEGKFWYIRSITIGGLSPTTTAAGRADVYATAMLPNASLTLAALGLADWRDQAATLPSVAFYARGALPLRMNENLVVVISNGTNGQGYVAVAQFEEYQEGSMALDWDV
jgi:hypothetical protein